jgi:ferritin-like protein
MSSFIPDSLQRKALEKVYARIFDLSNGTVKGKIPETTTEGKLLLLQAGVDAEDLAIKTIDEFINPTSMQQKGSPVRSKKPIKVNPPSP